MVSRSNIRSGLCQTLIKGKTFDGNGAVPKKTKKSIPQNYYEIWRLT